MKEEQVVAVKAILEGKDIFVVLPTGYGKSVLHGSPFFCLMQWCQGKDLSLLL